VDAMAKAIVYLADHPDIAATLGMQARHHISEYYALETSIEKLRLLLN
jgi:glycosyltransferase involved in cell wall biosynthesis